MTKETNAQTAAKTKDAVEIILTEYAGAKEEEAAELADTICAETLRTCRMIRSVEERCGKLCREMLTDNPSRDLSDSARLLQRDMSVFDGRRNEHGMPKGKGTAEEMAFRASLDKAREAIDEGRVPQMTDEEICDLISEIATRVDLYDALERGTMSFDHRMASERELFVPPQELRDCAYSAAVMMKDEQVRSDPAQAVFRACLVYRLGYIDQPGIEETDRKIAEWMNLRGAPDRQEAEAVFDEAFSSKADEVRMKKLCTAALVGGAALLLLRPVGKAAGAAAAVLAYLLLS